MTSVIEDIRIWVDRAGATPGDDLRNMLADYGVRGQRVGVEYHAYGLTAQRGKMVDAALEGFCETVDGSEIVRLVKLVKSDSEVAYIRRSGELADEALAISRQETKPGASIGAIYGDMIRAVMAGDGDPSASRWPMGAGDEAMMVRYHTGHGKVGQQDQVQFEVGSSYRHYHTALMYVILTGKVDPRQQSMFDACSYALEACRQTLRPGRTVGDVFDAHAKAFTAKGFGKSYLNACGYTMGVSYPPTWMGEPMIYKGSRQILMPNMVFFLHMVLLDGDTSLTMSLGETLRVTDGDCEQLNHAPTNLIVA